MTSPLVKPVSGYSTLLMLVSCSWRLSTSTTTCSGIAHRLVETLVRADAAKHRMTQPAVVGPVRELDFDDDGRLDPVHGPASRTRRRLLGQRAVRDFVQRRVQ